MKLSRMALLVFVIILLLIVVPTIVYIIFRGRRIAVYKLPEWKKILPEKIPKLVLAFYYPWYGSKYGPTHKWVHWNHWIMDTTTGKIVGRHNPDKFVQGRRDIGAAHYPLLGPYDCNDVNTLRTHFEWAEKAGIDVFVCSWWGIDSFEDRVFRKMLDVVERYNFSIKLTVYYESVGLAKQASSDRVAKHLIYILDNYSKRKGFFKIDGIPVIFVYAVGIRSPSFWRSVIETLWSAGYRVILIADTSDPKYAEIFHGIHIYSPLSLLKRDPSGSYLRNHYSKMFKIARDYNCIFVATVMPGYNDKIIRIPGNYLDRERGKIYNVTWDCALSNSPHWIIITSWNEWHEGTEIEPSREYGYLYLNLTTFWSRKFKGG